MKDTSQQDLQVDTHWNFVLSLKLTNKKVDEIKNALVNFDDVKDKIDLTKTMTTYGRRYPSTELMLKS